MTRFVHDAFGFARKVSATAICILVASAMASTSIGCAAPTRPSVTSLDRHVVPNGLVQASLEDFEVVSFLDVDLHTAVQTREAVESEFTTAYGRKGHPRWFFHAFDGTNLDFIVARFEPKDTKGSRYVAERRLRVKRTRGAERALGVTDVVREYEVGIRGIKAGMSRREVVRVAGRAEAERKRGATGTFELLYPSFCARFARGVVVHVFRRDMCTAP